MDYIGYAEEELHAAGAYWTAREIAQQPSLWGEMHDRFCVDGLRLQEFLRPLISRRGLRIVLTGAGTSAFVGDCLAPAIRRKLRLRADSVATTDLVSAPDGYLARDEPVLLVSFARSGNSPESVAAVELAERISGDCHHLVFTCNADGALAARAASLPRAHCQLLPERANDRSFAMTSSFSSMLLAAGLAFGVVLPRDGHVIERDAADSLRMTLQRARFLAAERFDRVVYLGAAELQGLARESALKMLELTDGKVVAVADSPLGFRHGPKTIINGRTLVVVFLSRDAYRRAYEQDLLRELRADGVAAQVVALSAAVDSVDDGSDVVPLPAAAEATELELCFPYVLFAQTLAFSQSRTLGIRPDSPNAAGTVSRVVHGVTIHAWSAR